MIDINLIFKNIISEEIKKIDERKSLYESILKDETILSKLETISSFKDISIDFLNKSNWNAPPTIDLQEPINVLFKDKILNKICYFSFDFKKSAKNKEIFIEFFDPDYDINGYCIENVLYIRPYFVENNTKYYSDNAFEFIDFKDTSLSYHFFDISKYIPKSFKNKIFEKIIEEFDCYLSNLNDVIFLKGPKELCSEDDFQNKLLESIDKRLQKEIFK